MPLTSDAVGHIWFVVALATLLLSIISAIFAFRTEHTRRLRCEFRKLLKLRLAGLPNIPEQEFAQIIITAMQKNDFQSLKKLSVEKYVSEYMGDLDFQPKLLNFLAEQVPEKIKVKPEVLNKTLDAIDGWRISKQLVERDILSYLEQIATKEGPYIHNIKKIRSYVESRHDNFFETKTNEFVEDVKHAVTVVSRR